MNLALPLLLALAIGYELTRPKGQGAPPLGGGFVRTIPVPPFVVEEGSTWFLVVLDTTAMNSAAGVGRALQADGWEPSGAFEQRGMISPGNPFGAQGMQYVLPVTRSGQRLAVIELPIPLGTGLFIIDGNPHAPPAPI